MELKKTFLTTAVVLALFLSTSSVNGVKVARHSENNFIQTNFVDKENSPDQYDGYVDAVVDEQENADKMAQLMRQAEEENPKLLMKRVGGQALAQVGQKHKMRVSHKISDDSEKTFNFERDIASARVQDPSFDSKVEKIESYMMNYRDTYKDSNYLRDAVPYQEMITRRAEDRAARHFEAQKQALDEHKSEYIIKQSEAIAKMM